MKRILVLALFAAAPVFAQTPEVDAWKAAKQAELAAHTAAVNAAIAAQTDGTNRLLGIQAGVLSISEDQAALRAQVTELQALVSKLQAAGQLTQQQLDQIRLVIPAQPAQ